MLLVGAHDRPPVLDLGPVHVPGTAGGAAAQRLDLHYELVAGLERLARPAVTDESARRSAFEAPGLAAAVLLLDDEDDERVRAGELEFLHRALEFERVLLIEHRK